MKRLLEWLRWFPHDHWRLYGAMRFLLILTIGICLIRALDKFTTWLLK